MKIVIINDTIGETSGSNQACARMAEQLSGTGCSVNWVGMADASFHAGARRLRALRERGVKLSPLALPRTRSAAASIVHRMVRPSACEKLAKTLEEFRPDAAVICNIHNVLSAAALGVTSNSGARTLFYPFDNWFWCLRKYNYVPGDGGPCRACKDGPGGRVFQARCGGGLAPTLVSSATTHWLWSTGGFRSIHRWICATTFHRDLLRMRGVSETRIAEMDFPVEADLLDVPSAAEGPLLYYGSVAASKGLATLARALCASEGLSIDLFLTEKPGGDLARDLGEAAKRNTIRVDSRKRWNTGLRDAVAASRAVVVPSTWDSVGEQVLLESQALGKAVVASDIEVHRRLVIQGETGWVFKVGDARELAACLAEAWSSPRKALALGESARARSREAGGRWAAGFMSILVSMAASRPSGQT